MVYIGLAAIVFLLDFLLKRHIDKTRKLREKEEILEGRIIVQKYYNEGAILDTLSKWSWLVRVISGMMMLGLGIIWLVLLRKKGNIGLKLGLTLVIGGGMSNLYDRFTKGHVIDYFSFKSRWKRLQQIIFNISDIFIFLGAFLMLFFGKNK